MFNYDHVSKWEQYFITEVSIKRDSIDNRSYELITQLLSTLSKSGTGVLSFSLILGSNLIANKIMQVVKSQDLGHLRHDINV